jgi:hypothetical protein
MRDLVPVRDDPGTPSRPAIVALGEDAPSLSALFGFMSDAELRFTTLRMRIVDRTYGARGEDRETVEVAIRHPRQARVVRRHGDDPLGREYDIWSTDGEVTTSFDARSNTARVRRVRDRVVGAGDPELPAFARLREPLTALPPESVAETFVHPHVYARNVLASGVVRLLGTTSLAGGRTAFVLRVDHPRTTHVLTDRPDHWLEVAVDRATGILLLLVEHVDDRITRHAEVTSLELDPDLPDGTFRVHLSADVRMMY